MGPGARSCNRALAAGVFPGCEPLVRSQAGPGARRRECRNRPRQYVRTDDRWPDYHAVQLAARVACAGSAVVVVSWPVVYFFLREPTAAEAAAQQRDAKKAFGLPFQEARRESTFLVLNVAFFLLGLTATSLVSQQVPLLQEAGWTRPQAVQLQTLFGFGLLFARVAVGFLIDHIFAPRVMMTVSIGGAIACVLYATYPNAAYVSALLIGFLLGAEFDVLAFLIKRYYGNVAYGKIYGVIFGVFYLGSGLGIAGIAWFRQTFGNYNNGLFVAAGVLVASAVLMVLLPAYRFRTGAEPPFKPQAGPGNVSLRIRKAFQRPTALKRFASACPGRFPRGTSRAGPRLRRCSCPRGGCACCPKAGVGQHQHLSYGKLSTSRWPDCVRKLQHAGKRLVRTSIEKNELGCKTPSIDNVREEQIDVWRYCAFDGRSGRRHQKLAALVESCPKPEGEDSRRRGRNAKHSLERGGHGRKASYASKEHRHLTIRRNRQRFGISCGSARQAREFENDGGR